MTLHVIANLLVGKRRIVGDLEDVEGNTDTMTEPKCRCWKPTEPGQIDCPVHGKRTR